MLYSIDRFEGDVAVLIDEDEESLTVPRASLPADAEEGMMFLKTEDGFVRDEAAEEARRAEILALLGQLRGDSE